ncbi:AI-2E family transporter [Leptospira sp. 2 VSF19]|uniref:AI-2E family transporter n=1 Tax=Leptospira soteropolitanensis TaxID=2950025 RepID=A0AAW5VKM7_9LEPT|nr:AI-2E family transporter [Leptospira soteropolitanensis]MCW7492031.1 AI-2E family transporter [Leptospira soteropolitanensis]MCW7499613.1 AI-2E family transporter [Leptospira soteropolitanensis]MCW7521864.1 AI-2E family transporter [Leptospira soteropolitanensis]MCW7525718.1 AI-2E family transporter [Leptospira soteropolitanensis]MCW7530168.1 AI-2E family transporter [Leptospira soteropolitanensis]
MNWIKNKNEIIVYLLLSAIFIGTCLTLFFVFKPFLWASFLALLFYLTTRKTHKKLKNVLGVKFHGLSPYIMVIIMLAGVFIPSYLIVSTLIRESLNLVSYIRNQLTEESIVALLLNSPMLTDFFTENEFFWIKLPLMYREYVGQHMDILNLDSIYSLLKNSSGFLLGSFEVPGAIIFNAFFTFILLFFLYKEGSRMEHALFVLLPFPTEIEERLGRRIEEAIRTVMMGNLFISLLQGALIYILLLFTSVSNKFLLSSIATIFSLIPVVGTSVVWLPIGLYIGLVQENWTGSILFMIAGGASYLILENLVKPKILDKKLKTHPFLIFLSLIGGLQEFGVAGIIIGPMALTLVIILWDFWKIFRETRFQNL